MPGLDLSLVSSNWKKLQEKLQTEKKTNGKPGTTSASTNNGTKRKRTAEENSRHINGSRKARRIESNARPQKLPQHRSKMGYSASKPSPATTAPSRATLTEDHDISQADLISAYGPSTTTSLTFHDALNCKHTDSINSGLHPTHKAGKYISLDCEMVGTGEAPIFAENVLARVSVVNFHGEQLYDSYVTPPPGIVVKDYRTQFSGIRPADLRAARPFDAVRDEIFVLLAGRVLVGHALRNDLHVLSLKHPIRDIRDTSRYTAFRALSAGKAPALRLLAEKELGWRIQTGEHSSLEDARAAMFLFRKARAGMEAEVVRLFGAGAVKGGKGRGGGEVRRGAKGEDGEDDEDVDVLGNTLDDDEDDEEGDENGDGDPIGRSIDGKPKKKRKKKKRTKRK